MEWKRVGVRQWVESPVEEKRRSSEEDTMRMNPFDKCAMWRWAMARQPGPAAEASYLDLLDQATQEYIINCRWRGVVKDRNAQGWTKVHEEFKLLPRCPVHDTVSLLIYILRTCRPYLKNPLFSP